MQVEEDGCLPAAVGGAADGGEGEHCGGASIWLSSVSVCVCVCVSSKTARLRQRRDGLKCSGAEVLVCRGLKLCVCVCVCVFSSYRCCRDSRNALRTLTDNQLLSQ